MLKLLKAFIASPSRHHYISNCIHNVRYSSAQHSKTNYKVLSMVSQQVPSLSPTITLTNWPYHLQIRPNDILDPNDVNSLRASIVSHDAAANPIPGEPLRIEITDNNISIQNTAGDQLHPSSSPLTCVLKVPVQSELNITSQADIHVEKLYSDAVRLRTTGNISTHNLNGFRFNFETDGGNVRCTGNTLANQIDIRARGNGNVHLSKMQGDLLYVLCDSGCIRTDSCYSEASKFVTLNGRLHLCNVHKFSEMYLLEGGRMDVTGFHGRLVAKLNQGGEASFQLTEVYGDSCIEAMGDEEAGGVLTVNVSDFVLENNALDVRGAKVRLDETLDEYAAECVDAEGKSFRRDNPNLNGSAEDRLTVLARGDVRLGKMSWTDTLKLKFNVK